MTATFEAPVERALGSRFASLANEERVARAAAALECAYQSIVLQTIVRKDLKLEWPRAETSTHFIMMGFDEDLNEAMKIAVRETVNFLAAQQTAPMSRDEAYALTSMVGDCRVTQVVDVRKGVHCMVPKSLWVGKHVSSR